jgi:hypothetical protein
MKINETMLSIPPYISTTWNRISAIHMKGNVLVLNLINGDPVPIPNLTRETIEQVFNYHAAYLEKNLLPSSKSTGPTEQNLDQQTENSLLRFSFGPFDGMGTALQHNPAQAQAPDLPAEVLQKISSIAKAIIPEEETIFQKPEPFCNCFYCQIARAIHGNSSLASQSAEAEPEVSDEDLTFQQWEIVQTGEKLFSVMNKLDAQEKYNVYLGQPVGCTCGKTGCEHILAVLKS